MTVVGSLGFIQNFSGGEVIVILIVALVVLGPERLPEMARGVGKMLHKVKGMTEGLQSEVKDVMDDPSMQPIRELGELAARPRQKLTEYALEAEAEERARKEAERAAAAAAAAAAAEQSSGPDGAETPDEATDGATAEHTPSDEATRPSGSEPNDGTTDPDRGDG